MKKIVSSVTFRAVIATALCITFIIYPQLRVSAAEAAYAGIDLKSASQYKTEASRYDNAIRAIAGIAKINLDNPDDLKKALAILDRERPNLRFHLSKLVVIGLNDSTFSSAVKKKVPDQQAAEAFGKELKADPKTILKLDGASALTTRMQQSSQADAAVLRRVAERLKDAADKIKKASQATILPRFGGTDEFKLIRAGFNAASRPVGAPNPSVITTQGGPAEILIAVVVIALVLAVAAVATVAITQFFNNLFPRSDREEANFEECQEKADDRLRNCLSVANTAPFPLNLAAAALCESEWLLRQAACWVS